MLPEEKIIEAYGAFGREIYTYLTRLLGDPDTAEDLLQDCFVNLMAYNSKREVRPGTLRPFLYRTAHNLAVNHMKKRAHRESAGLDEQVHVSPGGSPGETLERRELSEAIDKALTQLDETTRSLFAMRRELSMELAEIAGIMGMSEKTVRRKLTRAMGFLMKELKKGGFAP